MLTEGLCERTVFFMSYANREFPDNSERLSLGDRRYAAACLAEFTDVRKLCIAALMAALSVLLQYISIPLTAGLSIQVTFTVSAVSGAILGPLLSLIRGAVSDIVGFLVSGSGAFYPGYTLSAALGAAVYSLFLYRKKITFQRILAAKTIVNIFINAGLGSLWNVLLLGAKSYGAYFAVSISKNLLLLPIETMVLVALFGALTPPLCRMKLLPDQEKIRMTGRMIVSAVILCVLIAVLAVIYTVKPETVSTFFAGIYGKIKEFFKSFLK